MNELDKKKERRRRLLAELISAVIVYLIADTKPVRLLEQRFDEFCCGLKDVRCDYSGE